MSGKKNCSLTPANVAVLGIMDEIYDLYCSICGIYEKAKNDYHEKYGEHAVLWGAKWDDLCSKEVRAAFLPFLQSYVNLFSDDIGEVFSWAYAFNSFSFIKSTSRATMIDLNGSINVELISFTDFLFEFQLVFANIHFRWKNNVNPTFLFGQAWQEINNRLETKVKEQEQEWLGAQETDEEVTGYILYLFETLSSTQCFKKKHSVASARFVACFASGEGKIALPVHYCNDCRKYFIGKKTLTLFEASFGKLLVEKRNLDKEESNFEKFRLESKLHQLGYNVIEGNMNPIERKSLLIYLVEHDLISYFDLCSTLENNIRFFQHSGKHQLAVQKWKADLKAIGEYIMATKRAPNKSV